MSKPPTPAPKPGHAKPRAKKPHSAKPPTQRQLRVGEEVRHVLSTVFLRGEFRDPDLQGQHITVTEVRISPDLRNATAFVARLGRTDIEELLPALKRAAIYLRGAVAHEMRLRVAPNLTFQPDTTLDYAARINELLARPDIAKDLSPDTDDRS